MNLITLTTDFGMHDWFVGTMKAVILGINPKASVIDITHEIPPGDVRAGAFVLAASYKFAPKGTVHVVVVDPGVGSPRRAIAVKTTNYFFVGPDNGVLSWALRHEKIRAAKQITNERFQLQPLSRTFHGRDVFAPVAAHLSNGLPIRLLGPDALDIVKLPWPEPIRRDNVIKGEIVYIDRFGNAITNISQIDLSSTDAPRACVTAGQKLKCSIGEYYGAVGRGKPVAVFGSSGLLEIAVNCGNASKQFNLSVGKKVTVRIG